MVKNLPAMRETRVQSLGQEDLLEKGMATHSSIHAWRISWTEEPGGLQSTGSQRVRHNWVTNTFTFHSVNIPFICTGKPINLCNWLSCDFCFIVVVWNWTHNCSKVCLDITAALCTVQNRPRTLFMSYILHCSGTYVTLTYSLLRDRDYTNVIFPHARL